MSAYAKDASQRARILIHVLLVCILVLCAVGLVVFVIEALNVSREPTLSDLPMSTQIRRAGSNVRHAYLAAGRFMQERGRLPGSIEELYQPKLYADNPESWFDPFARRKILLLGRRYEFLRLVDRGTTVIIYSIGPDGVDEKGIVPYDPTNGLSSSGDIVGPIPVRLPLPKAVPPVSR